MKQAIVDEWCALSQKFIDHSINEWRQRLKHVIQQNGRHIVQRFSRTLYMAFLLQFMHILCSLLIFRASSTFICMLFNMLNRVKVTLHYLSQTVAYVCQILSDSVKAFERYGQNVRWPHFLAQSL